MRLRPGYEWGARQPDITRGSNHMRFVGADQSLRLTTDAPISYIAEERPFVVDRPMSFFFGSDEPLRSEVDATAREFLDKTTDYWRDWVRSLSIPFDWQEEVIRASITLKLCNYEETGAIVAALTTSVPEAPGTQRNWDYRFCWLRDAYFVIHALNRLGTTKTMEEYLTYITNIVDDADANPDQKDLPPLFSITRSTNLEEREATALAGYRGMGPVRVGNAAYTQIQNDAYGSIILASTHAFFDRRLSGRRTAPCSVTSNGWDAARSKSSISRMPARGSSRPRRRFTHSRASCAGRPATVSRRSPARSAAPDRAEYWRSEADRIHAVINERAFNQELGTFVSSFGGDRPRRDACCCLNELDFVKADDPAFHHHGRGGRARPCAAATFSCATHGG